MVRPDQDVMDTGRDEGLHHRQRTLGGTRVIGVLAALGVEDHLLPELVVLVDVDECLVNRIVRKHVGLHPQYAGPRTRHAKPKHHGMTVGQRFQIQPLEHRRRVRAYSQTRLDQSHHTIPNSRRLRWIEKPVRGLDTKVMCNVYDVQHESGVDDVLADDEVEKAEWSRMRQRSSRYDEEC